MTFADALLLAALMFALGGMVGGWIGASYEHRCLVRALEKQRQLFEHANSQEEPGR